MKRKSDCHYFTKGKAGWCLRDQAKCPHGHKITRLHCPGYKPAKAGRKRGKHGNYRRAAQEERAFLNERIAEGWLGSRSAGSHGVADVWLIAPAAVMWFTCPKMLKAKLVFTTANREAKKVSMFGPPLGNCYTGAAIQLKSTRALALKAARDWASGKAQNAWRTTWLKCKGHRKLAEKVNAPWFREWKERHDAT